MADSPLIRVSNLQKVYPNGVHALKGVSFDVRPGEFLVVIGLSGSGKSTLLRSLNHLVEPTSGNIEFKGRDITHPDARTARELRTRMAMIFQHFNLVGRHSVLSNALMGALHRTPVWRSMAGLFSEEDRHLAQHYLDLVGIGAKSRVRADSLSGGQQQRVAIARALMQKPEVLLADEPVASLDPATCHTVMDYLRKVNTELGITILCNLHFLSLVREYGTRVIALKGGEIVFAGSPSEIDDAWFARIYGEGAREMHIR